MVLMTEWNQYRALDLERLRASMKTPVFIDLRNVYDSKRMPEAGFVYHGVGRLVRNRLCLYRRRTDRVAAG